MKSLTLVALLFLSMAGTSVAGNGYHIHLKMPGVKDSVVYLVHYYGKSGATVYKSDSARFDKHGEAVFANTDPEFTGGIYMMMCADRKTSFEFLLKSGDDISITAAVSELPSGIKYKNAPENERFQQYEEYIRKYGDEQQALKKEYSEAKTAADTSAVRKKAMASSKDLNNYRRDYIAKYPNTLLANIFGAMQLPEVPEGTHYLEDGKTKDTTFSYHYYKEHYWDGFNFQDDRLIYTPIYEARLEEYMTKLVLPWPDSVEKESDMLLKKARGTKDMFKYTLWWLTRNVENSKVMGMDEVFVYLVENYYMKGDAFWLTNDELTKYFDRAQKIAPNVIGNMAPELKLPNVITKQPESLSDVKSNYTVVVFYSPNCGHCQHELPELDSVYEAVLKNKGVKIYTVATEGDEKAISDFLVKLKVDKKWINTWDPEHVSDYHNKYDVYSTPTIYLLDEKKIIRGKRLDHSNIANVIDIQENKLKDKAKTTKK